MVFQIYLPKGKMRSAKNESLQKQSESWLCYGVSNIWIYYLFFLKIDFVKTHIRKHFSPQISFETKTKKK